MLGVIVELRVQGNIEQREANPEYSLTWQAEMDTTGTTREQYDCYDENGDKAERRLPWVQMEWTPPSLRGIGHD
jgi:hypothetical protein